MYVTYKYIMFLAMAQRYMVDKVKPTGGQYFLIVL